MKVSVIIVNYNGKGYLVDCLDSVLKTNFEDFEVIVVDNASIDGSAEGLSKRVHLIRSKTNLFFTGGCNLGAKKAKGEWLIFLNPDTVVEPDWLEELIKEAKDKKLALQPKIKIYSTNKIDCVIGKYFWPGFGVAVGRGKADKYRGIIKGDYTNGTCLMINKNWFWHLGGFDENFKFFYEDVDLQLRAKKLGGQAIGVMKAVIYHKGSLSFKQNVANDTVVYYYRRNRLLTVIKNFKGIDRVVRLMGLIIISLFVSRLWISVRAEWMSMEWLMGKWFNLIRLNELKRIVGKKKFDLLDLGCGEGELIKMAKEKEIEAVGVDEKQGKKIESLKLDKKFETVSMFHVLEHVKNPRLVLNKVKQWLKPGGVLVIEVPLVDNLSEKWLGKNYLAYWDESHRSFFRKKDLKNLLEKTGWRIKKQGATWHQFPLTVISSSFKISFVKGLGGLVLWLPLKLLSMINLNDEMIRLYCVEK